jgi:hypothetical protein
MFFEGEFVTPPSILENALKHARWPAHLSDQLLVAAFMRWMLGFLLDIKKGFRDQAGSLPSENHKVSVNFPREQMSRSD